MVSPYLPDACFVFLPYLFCFTLLFELFMCSCMRPVLIILLPSLCCISTSCLAFLLSGFSCLNAISIYYVVWCQRCACVSLCLCVLWACRIPSIWISLKRLSAIDSLQLISKKYRFINCMTSVTVINFEVTPPQTLRCTLNQGKEWLFDAQREEFMMTRAWLQHHVIV